MGLGVHPVPFGVFADLVLIPPAEFSSHGVHQGSSFPGWKGERAQGMVLSFLCLIELRKVHREDGKNVQEKSQRKKWRG